MTVPTTPPASSGGSPETEGQGAELVASGASLQVLRQVAGVVVGQLSVLTALAFYFGWAHEADFLGYFGLSTSVVNLSTTDYLLNGVSVAYWPLMLLGILVVLAQAAHPRI